MNKTSSLVLAAASAAAVAVFSSCKPAQPAAEAQATPGSSPAATATAAPSPAATTTTPDSPATSSAPAGADGIKDPVATVNGEPITKAQLDEVFNEAIKTLGVPADQIPEDQKLMGYRQLLDRMIMDKLLTKAAEGTVVPQEEIDKQIAEIKAQFPSEEEFSKKLGELGQTPDQLNEKIKAALQKEKWILSQISDQTNVTDEDAKKFFDENKDRFGKGETVRASHILFMVKPDATEEEEKQQLEAAKKAIARAKKEDFAKLAKELSQDPGSAEQGGDLDYFEKGQMVPEFADAAFSQKVNTVSAQPVKSQFGYHVIKVTDKKPAQPATFEAEKERILTGLKGMKEEQAVNNLFESLRSSAKIENTLPEPPAPALPQLPTGAIDASEPEAPTPATEPPGKGN
jgi:peptidyl-prolyl cis-trans isomerase C